MALNPHKKNKVDISSLNADEQRLFRLYGKLPTKSDLLQNKLKERKYFDSGDYALSKAGKASDTGVTSIGTEHPSADSIPHAMSPLTNTISRGDSIVAGMAMSPTNNPMFGNSSDNQPMVPSPAGVHRGSINGIPGGGLPGAISASPVKESSHLAKTTSRDDDMSDQDSMDAMKDGPTQASESVSPPQQGRSAIPIRR